MDKYFYITLHSGLCNRLSPLMSAVRLATKTNRKVVCYWKWNPGRAGFPYNGHTDFLDIFKPIENVEIISEPDLLDRVIKKPCDFYNFDTRANPTYIVNMNTDSDIFIFDCLSHIYSTEDGIHNWVDIGQREITPQFRAIIDEFKYFFTYFKPVEPLQERIESIKGLFGSKMIGIHIRRTDGHFQSNWKESDTVLIERVKTWVSEGYVIFLATDDPNYETVFGDKNILINKQHGKYNNDKTNTMSAVVDLYLLSHCPTIIGTYGSSFSMTSYFFSENSVIWTVTEDPESVRKINV